jgi:hypothetical protein
VASARAAEARLLFLDLDLLPPLDDAVDGSAKCCGADSTRSGSLVTAFDSAGRRSSPDLKHRHADVEPTGGVIDPPTQFEQLSVRAPMQ